MTKIYKIYYFLIEIFRCTSMINFLIKKSTKRKSRNTKKKFLKVTIYSPQTLKMTNNNMKAYHPTLLMKTLPVNMTQMATKLYLFQDICKMHGELKKCKRIWGWRRTLSDLQTSLMSYRKMKYSNICLMKKECVLDSYPLNRLMYKYPKMYWWQLL